MTLNNWNIKCRVLAGTKGKGSLQKSKLETKHHMVCSQVTATSAEEGGALPAKAHGGTGGCGGAAVLDGLIGLSWHCERESKHDTTSNKIDIL